MIYFVIYETIKFNLLYPQMIGFKISFSQKKKNYYLIGMTKRITLGIVSDKKEN